MNRETLKQGVIALLFIGVMLVTACAPAPAAPTAAAETPTKTQAPPSATPLPPATPTAAPVPAVWVDPDLPAAFIDALPTGKWLAADHAEDSTAQVILATGADASAGVDWVYALVAPFPTVTDAVTLADLQSIWQSGQPGALPCTGLLADPSTLKLLTRLWGTPSPTFVRGLEKDRLVQTAWSEETTWAIVPFEDLEPRWKVLMIDGQSPVKKAFDPTQYGLTLHFGVAGAPPADFQLPQPNRDPAKLTTVMLTGVTALVRGTAALMEYYGSDYPAQFIGDILRDADILHISNEVPFAEVCPDPYPWEGLAFCSREKYIGLLDSIGTDVVELTGDHFFDWGVDAMNFTLDLYDQRGWPHYGGGRNLDDGWTPVKFDHNGNKIAFIGCNGKDPGYAQASATNPGAVHCDFERMAAEIKELRAEGYLPIATFQHLEYYSYTAHPILQHDFHLVADAGAEILSGSQAHQPHAFEFYQPSGAQEEAFIHYGVGNLFFDQLKEGYPCRQSFLDRYVIYDNQHISTELETMLFIDYARARLMTPEERADLLTTIFKASGW